MPATATAPAPELAAFLTDRVADFAQQLSWQDGLTRMQLRGYLTADEPPDAFVLAGRVIVVDGDWVLVVRDRGGQHVLPGGRREVGETGLASAQREVIEETGWSIAKPAPLGVIHLHYETPEPSGVGRYIYPDFLWHVFVAEPASFDASARHTGGHEIGASFRPIAQVLELPLDPFQKALLEAARAVRRT